MLAKLISNLGFRAIQVVGWRVTLKMWRGFILNIQTILKSKNLFTVDKFMSDEQEIIIKHEFGKFKINPLRIDTMIVEESYCFSSVRELYIKDCYFRFHKFKKDEIKTVVDLGANRGMFSVMCTPFAEQIIAIEAEPKFINAIKYNINELNGFKNLNIENYFIRKSKPKEGADDHTIDFNYLINKYKLTSIDFLKIDIEGSEFDIVHDLPFGMIKYFTMEIHRDVGSPERMANILTGNGFDIIMATSRFHRTTNYSEVDYIYGKNLSRIH